MVLRYLIPALAVAGRVAAQCSGTTTIQNTADASALSTCYTYSGSIAVATGTVGDIAIDGVRRITGDLSVKKTPNMTSLSGDSLQQVDGTFELNNVQTLSTVNFPYLATVDTIFWSGLPNLQGLELNAGLSKVNSLTIQNTQLSSLLGIDLMEVGLFNVNNNGYLNDITMQLGNVSTSLSVSSNGRDTRVSFPNMIWANNMTYQNCSSVDVPSLASLNSSLGFYGNYFSSLSAPNLTLVGGGVAFVSNNALTNISMPQLKQINGGLQIANNTHVETVDGFPRLVRVGGAIDFNGEFSTVKLPALGDVRGAFNVQSTQNIDSSCSHFRPLSGVNNVIKGNFNCQGKVPNPGGIGTHSSGGGSGGSGQSGSNAGNSLYISYATVLMGAAAAVFGML